MLSAIPLGEVGKFGEGLLSPFCSSAPRLFNQVRVECLEMETEHRRRLHRTGLTSRADKRTCSNIDPA
jgi:hypothetical protein